MNTDQHSNDVLYVAFETSQKTWGLTFTTGRRRRQVVLAAWDLMRLDKELDKARVKLGRSPTCKIYSCYEAGRDGFSIHRMLVREFDIVNIIVDPASIEVNRRKRRCKTDRLDGHSLARMLFRYYELEEEKIWSVVRIPSVESEDERRLGREMDRLKKEKGQHSSRLKSLLATIGITGTKRIDSCNLEEVIPDNYPTLLRELRREQRRLSMVVEQIKEVGKERAERLKNPQTKADKVAEKLHKLKSIGPVCSWNFSKEYFGWRQFSNRREIGGLAGLTGTPFDSGNKTREQGISKAGRGQMRKLAVELAWLWLRYQPDSELTKWYYTRFDPSDLKSNGGTNARTRRIGIVALARKLLVALWKYVEFDEVPEGAVLKEA